MLWRTGNTARHEMSHFRMMIVVGSYLALCTITTITGELMIIAALRASGTALAARYPKANSQATYSSFYVPPAERT